MQIEIHTPELEQRVRGKIQSGQYHDTDELFIKALDALDEKPAPGPSKREDSGAAILAVLQDSPYPEIDLAPARDRVPVQVRDNVL